MKNYYPNVRQNDPVYLMRHVDELLKIAKAHKNSSSLIYACLDSRIALEYVDLYSIIASVEEQDKTAVLVSSKPKNGIDRLNNKHKSLKEKYQIFFQIVSEILEVKWIKYDYKKSKELQFRLSSYIHSYHMLEDEICFDSDIMQAVFPLIEEVKEFIKSSIFDGKDYRFLGIEISTIPEEDKLLLQEWKDNAKMTQEELKEKLLLNLERRK